MPFDLPRSRPEPGSPGRRLDTALWPWAGLPDAVRVIGSSIWAIPHGVVVQIDQHAVAGRRAVVSAPQAGRDGFYVMHTTCRRAIATGARCGLRRSGSLRLLPTVARAATASRDRSGHGCQRHQVVHVRLQGPDATEPGGWLVAMTQPHSGRERPAPHAREQPRRSGRRAWRTPGA